MTKSVKSRLISGNNFLTMKINFKFYYLFLILFFLLLNKAYSFDTDCSRFLDDLKNNYNKYSLGDYPTIIQKNYGFEIHKKFDQSKDEFVFARDKNEYFSVGKLLSPIVYNKGLRIGDKILSINDVDVRSLSEEKFQIFY